jgi:methyltransferase (TIGR00027 family)
MTMSMGPARQLPLIILVICEIAAAAAQTGRPSATALEMTAYRALGAKHPNPAIRNADRLAERFLGVEERRLLKEAGSEVLLTALEMDTESAWASLGNRSGLARAVHVRTRHIDDVVDNGLKTGISQIVNLGAGLDSRAYRIDALRSGRVFELDLPATQEYKKKRVREILGSLPGHVT